MTMIYRTSAYININTHEIAQESTLHNDCYLNDYL